MSAQRGVAEASARNKGASTASEIQPRIRLTYLDGLRALAASYVVAFHAVPGFCGDGLSSGAWRLLRRLLAFGHEAVAVFIVLSGYCLMLPVVRARPELLETQFGRFIKRRALRILPPYFAALALSVAAIAWIAPLRTTGTGTIWDNSLPGLELGPLLSHVLLVHNWSPTWGYQINGPLWSVASEWQLYFAFPPLLWLWRRFGLLAASVAALSVGYAPLLFVRAPAMVASPWYLVLFGLGMLAAAVGFSTRAFPTWLRERVVWSQWCAALWLGCLVFSMWQASLWFGLKPLTDLLVGLATATLLIHLTERTRAHNGDLLLRLLEARPLVAIGNFSYSLYLTHLPVVALCYFLILPWGLSASTRACAMLVICGPASLAVAYVFHLAVERPSLKLRG